MNAAGSGRLSRPYVIAYALGMTVLGITVFLATLAATGSWMWAVIALVAAGPGGRLLLGLVGISTAGGPRNEAASSTDPRQRSRPEPPPSPAEPAGHQRRP